VHYINETLVAARCLGFGTGIIVSALMLILLRRTAPMQDGWGASLGVTVCIFFYSLSEFTESLLMLAGVSSHAAQSTRLITNVATAPSAPCGDHVSFLGSETTLAARRTRAPSGANSIRCNVTSLPKKTSRAAIVFAALGTSIARAGIAQIDSGRARWMEGVTSAQAMEKSIEMPVMPPRLVWTIMIMTAMMILPFLALITMRMMQ